MFIKINIECEDYQQLLLHLSVIKKNCKYTYKANVNLKNGLSLLVVILLLIINGYLLYYAGGDVIIRYSSLIHSGLGVILIPVIYLHTVTGKKLILGRKRTKN